MDSADKTVVDERAKQADIVVHPNCTRCQGTSYNYRHHTIAGVQGLLVYCNVCGEIIAGRRR